MATGLNIIGKSLEDLEKEITCGICQEHYSNPKVLPCCHYYCKQCILRLALRTGADKPFSCPECRNEATLPEGNVDKLQTAFFVDRFKAIFSRMEQAHRKAVVQCEGCEEPGAKAEAFCRQCSNYICGECIESHKKMNVFRGHEIVLFEEMKEGGAKDFVFEEPPIKKCDLHYEPMTVYCFDCNSLICRDCTVKDHREHNFQFSEVAAPDTKELLLKELDPLRKEMSSISHAVGDIKITEQEVDDQEDSMVKTMH